VPQQRQLSFLGRICKIEKKRAREREATVSFVMPVCRKSLGCHWMAFHEILFPDFF
jgi:hypothetical protein